MLICYGVEMSDPGALHAGSISGIIKESAARARVFDRDDLLFIVESPEEAGQLEETWQSRNLYNETYTLILITDGAVTPLFFDYGFESQAGGRYVYAEMADGFQIKEGDSKQIQMALHQMQEHLIAKDTDGEHTVYLYDRQHKELMERFAKAYSITIKFLNLDK
ncbi:hypothetical protein [Bacillus marinisedimentorum]|uniref:hypothetical protein n=1 Tax=Bacillus marinisedimentorum TaxID=1821260 RepID=UPI000871B4D7|nr:hypothetical protein [Bacillus marinisedimentorum]